MPAKRDMSGVSGPTWSDVRLMMMEVGAANDVRIDIHASCAMGVNRSESMVWTVRAFLWGGDTWGAPWTFESGLWPTNMFVSVPALLYNLLHKLDHKLANLRGEEVARRQAGLFDG